jgi:cytochrome P450
LNSQLSLETNANQFLDSSTEFIFGESVNSLLHAPVQSQEFLDAFSQALLGAGRRAQAGKLRFIFMFDNKKWKDSYGNVHAFIDKHVARALAKTKPGTQAGNDLPTPHRYILVDEMAKQIRDPIDLRFQVLNVFFPARDSTGIALSNALFNLSRKPDVWRELREQALALGDRPLTFEALKSLPLFKYVLFESLRLQGPSGRIARTAVRDTILPRGGGPNGAAPIFVPKGTVVALNTYAPNHWKDVWGDDVEAFRPQRWVGSKHTWDWTPFFGGPRICPAQQQVLTQAVYLLVRMVTAFERIENRDPEVEYVELTKMLTESRNGVKVTLFPPGLRV